MDSETKDMLNRWGVIAAHLLLIGCGVLVAIAKPESLPIIAPMLQAGNALLPSPTGDRR